MNKATQYLSQGINGNLGKYQVDAKSLEKLGFLKSGTVDKAKSAADAINSAANWTGAKGIASKADFLSNPAIQESVVGQMFEKNYQTLSKMIPNFSKLTDSEVAGLLQTAQISGVEGVQSLMNSFGGKVPGLSSLPTGGLPSSLAVNPADIAAQPSPSCFFGMLPMKFMPAQLQALTAQTAKITSKLPVSIPGPLQKLAGPAAALSGGLAKLPGLSNLPGAGSLPGVGGMQSLVNGTGGLNKSLGGIAGAVSKLPGGLSNVPGNLSSIAGKIPPSITNKVGGMTGGLTGGLNKISQVTGKLPGKLNDIAGTIPTNLTKVASVASAAAAKAPSLVQQYQAGYNASELAKKIVKV